jgi:PAS domain S-box-containing protein
MSSERNLSTLIEKAFDAISVIGPSQTVIYASPSTERVLGLTRAEWLGQNPFSRVHPDDLPGATELWNTLLEKPGATVRVQLRCKHGSGKWIWLDCSASNLIHDPEVGGVVCNYLDITLQKEAELEKNALIALHQESSLRKLARLNNLLKLLEQFNRAVAHSVEEKSLLDAFCRQAVELCGYALIWVGRAGEPPLKRIVPIAQAGPDKGYLDAIELFWDESLCGQGPAGRSVRSGCPVVVPDISVEPNFKFKEAARRCGYQSCAVLPLRTESEVYGLLLVYSSEINGFDAEEAKLLGQAADDLSYGVMLIRQRKAREAAEKALKEREEFFREMTENSLDIVCLITRDLRVVYKSPSVEQVLGYSPQEVNERSVLDFLHPDDVEAILELNRSRETLPTESRRVEARFLHKNGEWRVLEAYSRPLKEGGAFSGFVIHARDITDRIRAESALRESEWLYHSTFEEGPNGIAHMDLSGNYVKVNRRFCELLQYSREELLKMSFRQITHPEDLVSDLETMKLALSRQISRHKAEKRYIRKDGKVIWCLRTASAHYDEQGNLKHCLVAIEDITEKKLFEKEFYRAQRMEGIGTLAAGIAHDLNNILAPIMMSAELIGCGMSPEDQKQSLKTILDSAQRGAEIIKQVLTFGRGVKGEKIPIQPRFLVKEMAKIARETFPRSIRVESSAPDTMPTIIGDPTQMHQVLLNLAINARDAMPQGGVLSLNLEEFVMDADFASLYPEANPGLYVHFSVVDTGTGITQENLEQIFLPFFTTKEPGKGTGLGLSTVLGIVKSHGGLVRVESTVGKGSAFHVYIPAAQASLHAAKSKAPAVIPHGEGKTILVVDDEPALRGVTRQALEKKGYEVLTAGDGVEGFSAYAQARGKIDLVLTDIMMPVMDGVLLSLAIRRLDPKIPIIATSGLACDQELTAKINELRDLGISALLNKPCPSETLLMEIANALKSAQR